MKLSKKDSVAGVRINENTKETICIYFWNTFLVYSEGLKLEVRVANVNNSSFCLFCFMLKNDMKVKKRKTGFVHLPVLFFLKSPDMSEIESFFQVMQCRYGSFMYGK